MTAALIRFAWSRPVGLAAGFLAVAVAVAVNALFLQTGPHPSPFHFAAGSPKEPLRADPLVAAVQEALKAIGYFDDVADGIRGPRTEAAIRRFEQAAGRPATGRASLDLLAAIVAARATAESVAISEATTAPPEKVAAIQRALARAAYGPLQADGRFGRETSEAIRRFQTDHQLPVNGEISDALMVELRAAGALEEN